MAMTAVLSVVVVLATFVVVIALVIVRLSRRGQAKRRSTWGAGRAGAGGYYNGGQTGVTSCSGSQYRAGQDFGAAEPGHSHGGNDHHPGGSDPEHAGHTAHDQGEQQLRRGRWQRLTCTSTSGPLPPDLGREEHALTGE